MVLEGLDPCFGSLVDLQAGLGELSRPPRSGLGGNGGSLKLSLLLLRRGRGQNDEGLPRDRAHRLESHGNVGERDVVQSVDADDEVKGVLRKGGLAKRPLRWGDREKRQRDRERME